MVGQIIVSLKVMWKYARSVFIGKALLMIISSALISINVVFMQKLIDNMLAFIKGECSLNTFIFTAMSFGSLLLLDAVLASIDGFLDVICDRKLTVNFEPIIIRKFRNLDYFCYEYKDAQNTMQRMKGQPYIHIKNVYTQTLYILQIILTLSGLALIYIQVSVWLIAALLVFLVPMLWVNSRTSFHEWKLFEEQTADERALNYLDGLLSAKASLFELKVFRAQSYIEELRKVRSDNMLSQKAKVLLKVQRLLFVKGLFAALWYLASIVTTLLCFLNNTISIGLFISLVNVSISIVSRISDLSDGYGELSKEVLAIGHYNDFMELPEYKDTEKISLSQPVEIEFENVRFKYPDTGVEVLKGISFTVKTGENVAIVGANGAGKSTIIKLLCKLYKPDSGSILINGTDLQKLSLQNIRKTIGILFQDYFKYELTIRENLAFGDLNQIADDNVLMQALNESKSYDICKTAVNGLDSNLGKLEDDGIDLSGGQWQRLAIGRACLSDAPVVVLDEPTASLDPVAESEMYNLFFNLMNERGTIMISHRLASSKMADKIIVLDKGVVTETGTHAQLMAQNGLYSSMFNTQASWYTTTEEITYE